MTVRAETEVTLVRVNDGENGTDGFSPTATVTKSGDTATITITDKNGTTTETVSDGQDGSPGVSVSSVKTQYFLSSSDTTAPSASDPGWSDTPQTFERGKYYWTRDYITYSNSTNSTSTAVYNRGLTYACEYAETAGDAADNASEYAARALGNLSTVQSVTETLNWITQHGTMALTTDTALEPSHVYFVVDAQGDYVVGTTHYSIVTEPNVADISTYYELTIDESLNNYVGTHLALTSEGLWLLPASTGTNRVLIATGAGSVYTTAGTYIIGSDGTTVLASFRADGTTIGQVVAGEYNTNIDTTGLDIRDNATSVAKFGISARIGEESNGGSKVIISPDSFTLYSKENATVFKTGVDSGGTVETDINIGNESTKIVIDSTTISNGASSSVSGFAILPALNTISNSVNFYVQLGTFKRTDTGISYISITNFVTFVKGTSDAITDSGITISYNGSDTLTVSGSYTNNTGATLTLADNIIRARGNTAAITVPLYDTMVNGNATFNINGGNTVIGLPLKSSQRFDDYELYQSIVALGWETDVMVGLSFARSTETRSVGASWFNTITTVPKGLPITCISDNTSVVTITNYDSTGQPIFKAISAGTCTITAMISVGGVIYYATCSVTVT